MLLRLKASGMRAPTDPGDLLRKSHLIGRRQLVRVRHPFQPSLRIDPDV